MAALDVLWAALKSPGGKRVLVQVAQQVIAGREKHEDLHWGREGQGATIIDVPDGDPIVALGALASVSYITQKGAGDRSPTEYVHTFHTPLPWLYVNGDGELLIVRGRSRYRVNTHGIIG